MTAPRGLFVDLDDTLYDYAPAERRGRAAAIARFAADAAIERARASELYAEARARAKARIPRRGSAHSRLLYLCELAHLAGRVDLLVRVRAWERAFWTAFLDGAALRPHARELLEGFRARGGKVAVVTDLVLEVQLWKLEAFGLVGLIDALAVSEEVPHDKPEAAIFELAAARLGVPLHACVMIGDDPQKDGAGARALGLPYYHAMSSEHPERGGMTLEAIAREVLA